MGSSGLVQVGEDVVGVVVAHALGGDEDVAGGHGLSASVGGRVLELMEFLTGAENDASACAGGCVVVAGGVGESVVGGLINEDALE